MISAERRTVSVVFGCVGRKGKVRTASSRLANDVGEVGSLFVVVLSKVFFEGERGRGRTIRSVVILAK